MAIFIVLDLVQADDCDKSPSRCFCGAPGHDSEAFCEKEDCRYSGSNDRGPAFVRCTHHPRRRYVYTSNNLVDLILSRIHNDGITGTPIRPIGASEEFRQDQARMGDVCWSYIALADSGRYQERRPGCFRWHLDHNRKKWMGIPGKYGPALKITELIIEQVESFEADLEVEGLRDAHTAFTGIFIRAPVVLALTPSPADPPIRVIARLAPNLLPHSLPSLDNDDPKTIVALRQGMHFLTTFHPELTHDDRFHEYFVRECVLSRAE